MGYEVTATEVRRTPYSKPLDARAAVHFLARRVCLQSRREDRDIQAQSIERAAQLPALLFRAAKALGQVCWNDHHDTKWCRHDRRLVDQCARPRVSTER